MTLGAHSLQEIARNGNSIEVLLLLAETYLQVGEIQRAIGYLDDILVNYDKRNGKALCLMGELVLPVGAKVTLFQAMRTFCSPNRRTPSRTTRSRWDCAFVSEAGQDVELTCPAYIDSVLLFRMGTQYLQISKFYEAADAFSRGCQMSPSASMWLGLGRSHFARADFAQAEEALAEANIMDCHNPEVWGWLALTALRANKIPEADQALKEALKNDLTSAPLFRDIGRQYLKAGQLGVAESTLRRCVLCAPPPLTLVQIYGIGGVPPDHALTGRLPCGAWYERASSGHVQTGVPQCFCIADAVCRPSQSYPLVTSASTAPNRQYPFYGRCPGLRRPWSCSRHFRRLRRHSNICTLPRGK